MVALAGMSGAFLYSKYGNNMKKAYKKTMKKAKKNAKEALEEIDEMN